MSLSLKNPPTIVRETDLALAMPRPVLYAESDLTPVPAQRAGGVPRLVEELRAAADARQRERLVRARLDDMGFEWMGYGTVSLPRTGGPGTHTCLTTYANPAWVDRYFGERYYEVDPRHLEPPRSSLPLLWDLNDIDANLKSRPASGRTRRFMEDFRDSGIRSGVFLRIVPLTQPGHHIVISLMSSAPSRRWIVDRLLGDALTFSLSLHEFMTQHVQGVPGQAAAADSLSDTQQEVLRQLARGLTDKQIADHLRVSSHTVDYHMRQLRQRFAARNRVQLVNAALQASAA